MTRLSAAVLAALLTTAVVGCGDDNPTDPGPTLSLSIVSGDGQVAALGVALSEPFVVEVADASGSPAGGQTVTWTLASAAGPNSSLSATSSVSGTDGRASVNFTVGDAAGTYEVRASVSGSTVTFSAEATASGSLAVVSGNGQVGPTSSPAAQPLVVRVVGPGAVGVPGVEVTFAVTLSEGSGASVNPATAITGANGEASTVLTFGDANGGVTVSATAGALSTTFSGYACGGDAAAAVLDLQPGEDAVITYPEVACVQLPEHAAGAEYEVAMTPLPQTLGFNRIKLALTGTAATSPAPAVVSSASGLAAGPAAYPYGTGSDVPDWRGRQYAWDMQLRDMERSLRPQIQANAVGPSAFGLMAAPPQVGDVMDFGFSCVTQTQFPNTPTDITAEVVAVSNNAVIFEDTLSRGAFTAGEYGDISLNFDDVIIGTDTLYFGAPVDVQGDIAPGQVVILYTQGVNRMTEDYSDGFIAGFFCPLDLGFAGGNDAKMFYVLVPDPNGDYTPGSDANLLTKANVLRITDNTVAHELQHLINAQVGGPVGAAQEVWINEGLSHLAEEVVGHATSGLSPGADLGPVELLSGGPATDAFLKYYRDNFINLGRYLEAPADTAALLNSDDPLGMNTFRMRGANWSFLRYLLDRFGTPATEWQMTRALITDGATSSRQAVTNVFGLPFNALAADWAAMLTIEDRDDLGGVPASSLTLASYQLRAMYEASATFNGQYPLSPVIRFLNQPANVDMDLFTGTTMYVTLRANAASDGTGLRLMQAITGADLSASIMPYMEIVRTK